MIHVFKFHSYLQTGVTVFKKVSKKCLPLFKTCTHLSQSNIIYTSNKTIISMYYTIKTCVYNIQYMYSNHIYMVIALYIQYFFIIVLTHYLVFQFLAVQFNCTDSRVSSLGVLPSEFSIWPFRCSFYFCIISIASEKNKEINLLLRMAFTAYKTEIFEKETNNHCFVWNLEFESRTVIIL